MQFFCKQYGVDFDEIFASFLKSNFYKVLSAIATFLRWLVDNMNFITTLSKGAIDDHIILNKL